jgi:hypothetical protein
MARRMMKTDKPGYNDMLPFFKGWMARRADEGNKKLVEELVVNDEMVTYNGRRGQDTFRVVNGRITDHWDASPMGKQSLPGENNLGGRAGGPGGPGAAPARAGAPPPTP